MSVFTLFLLQVFLIGILYKDYRCGETKNPESFECFQSKGVVLQNSHELNVRGLKGLF